VFYASAKRKLVRNKKSMQTLVCAIDEAEETQLTEDTELEIEEIDPGTVFVMSVAELQNRRTSQAAPARSMGPY
jgi:hypothetical protein